MLLTHWLLGDLDEILATWFSSCFSVWWLRYLMKLLWGECHWILMMINQHWQVMAWCHQSTSHYLRQCWPRSLSRHGASRPQLVNPMWLCEAIWHQTSWSSQHWFRLWPVLLCKAPTRSHLHEPMLTYCQADTWEQLSVKIQSKQSKHFLSRKCICKCLQNISYLI